MRLPYTVAIWLLVVLSACAATPESVPPRLQQWEIDAVLTIGGADSGPASFTSISSVDVDQDGRILVLDREAQQVRIFEPSGNYFASFGRPGAGPGELRRANGFRIGPDRAIWVNNPGNKRISVYRPDGSLLRELSPRISSYSFREWEAWFDGDVLHEVIDIQEDTLYVDHLRRFHPDGRIDTLPAPCEGLIPRPTRNDSFIIQHDRGTTSILIPWKPRYVRVFDRLGHAWCGVSDQYTLRRVGISPGDTLVLRGSRQPAPVTARDRDSMIDMVRRLALTRNNLSDPDWSRIPTTKPILDDVRIDNHGWIWIHVAVDGPVQLWEVFSAEGVPVAEVRSRVPYTRWGPLSIRDSAIYGVVLDSNDVQSVVVGRIRFR